MSDSREECAENTYKLSEYTTTYRYHDKKIRQDTSSSINNGENGLIVSMNGESVAEGLMQLSENQQLRNQLVENLKKEKTGNEEEINKYIQLIEENLS